MVQNEPSGTPSASSHCDVRGISLIIVGIVHARPVFALGIIFSRTVPGVRRERFRTPRSTAFYNSEARRRLILVGSYVMPFAGMAFVWFIVSLRMWIAGEHPARECPALQYPAR